MLTPPSVEDLDGFRHVTSTALEEDGLAWFLQAATDLMEVATGLHQEPTDSLGQRTLQRGILDMAWFLGTSLEERDALFSPFSSERIGSYSYSKSQQAVALHGPTGVPFFDLAVLYFAELSEAGCWSAAEHVMPGTLAESITPFGDQSGSAAVFG